MAKIKDKLKEDVLKSPISYILIILCLAGAGAAFPVSWTFGFLNKFTAMALVRTIFSVGGIILIIMCGFGKGLKIGKSALKNFDIFFAALLIAVNNFPFIALFTHNAEITAESGELLSYLYYCISVGLFEEIFFRGLLFPLVFIMLKDKTNHDFWAVILTSAIFGAFHILNIFAGASIGAVLFQVGYTFLNGLVFTLVFYFTKSVYFPIICHAVFDIGGLLIDNLGKGNIWDNATIALTAIVAVVVAAYLALRFFLYLKKQQKDLAQNEGAIS